MAFADDKAVMESRVSDTLALAQGYLDALTNAANVTFSAGLPAGYNYASVPQITFPLARPEYRPDVTTLGTIPAPDAPEFSFSSLVDIAFPTDDLLIPSNNFSFYEAAYSSVLLDPLKAKLLYDLTYGGYGIDTTDEVALFNRARDREVEAMLSRVEDAGRAMASRGFPLPPGELSIHVDRAYQGMQDKISDVSRDITLQRNKLFVENRQFTIREVRELEQITMGFWNSVQERAFNAAKASAEFAILYFNALVARYKARLDATKIESEVQFQKIQTEAERARAYIEVFRGKITAYEMNLRRLIDSAKLEVDMYRGDIDLVRIVNDGTVAQVTLQQKVLEATKQQNIQLDQLTIENHKVGLLALIEGIKFQTAAAQFGSTQFFAQLTALINTLNVLTVESTTV